MKTPTPTSDKEKILIQRGDKLYCDECAGCWTVGNEELHLEGCSWWPGLPSREAMDKMRERDAAGQNTADKMGYLGKMFAERKPPIPVVPIYGWVCSRCQRVLAPHVSECPHCQPGACGASRLDGEV